MERAKGIYAVEQMLRAQAKKTEREREREIAKERNGIARQRDKEMGREFCEPRESEREERQRERKKKRENEWARGRERKSEF